MARKRNAPLLTGLWVVGFLGAGACGGDDEPTTAKTFAAAYVNDWETYCTRVGLCSAEAGQVCEESILEPAAVEAAVDEAMWTSRDMDTCAQALRKADDCRLAGSCDQLLGTSQDAPRPCAARARTWTSAAVRPMAGRSTAPPCSCPAGRT